MVREGLVSWWSFDRFRGKMQLQGGCQVLAVDIYEATEKAKEHFTDQENDGVSFGTCPKVNAMLLLNRSRITNYRRKEKDD